MILSVTEVVIFGIVFRTLAGAVAQATTWDCQRRQFLVGAGYRGRVQRLEPFKRSSFVNQRSVVAPPGHGPPSVLADPARRIERYLLDTSRPHVTADEYIAIEHALAEP